MREALAAADHDFVLAEPASKSRRFKDKENTGKRRGASRPARRTRRYAGWLAGLLCVATMGGILVNALTLQKTRHPAPLFARAAPAHIAREPSIAETVPVAGPRSAPKAAAANPPAVNPTERAPRPALAAPPSEAAEPQPHDSISQLLKAPVREPAAKPAPAKSVAVKPVAAKPAAEPSKPVASAQRALVKLGYVLKADGVAGATTRQAIERYERDHKLPVRGELTPALMRHLSAAAGVPIN